MATRRNGQVIKKGPKLFLVRIFLGRDEAGKRRYHNKTVHGTKGDADQYLAAALREQDLGRFVEPTRDTFGPFVEKWLDTVARPKVAPRTLDDYERIARCYLLPTFGTWRLDRITPMAIQALYSKLLDRGGHGEDKGLSARTVLHAHRVLSQILKQAARWKLIPSNPCSDVDPPKPSRREMNAMDPDMARRFIEAARGERWEALFLVAITSGLRFGELAGLQWQDVDWTANTISVQRTFYRHRSGGGWSLQEPKTQKSRRSVTLSTSVMQALRAHRKRQLEERLACPNYAEHNFVFACYNGSPLNEGELLRAHYRPLLRKAGIATNIRFHDLRHSCATLLLAGGEHPKVVQERLGHSTFNLTMDTYTHVVAGMQKQAADKLEGLLFGTPDGSAPHPREL